MFEFQRRTSGYLHLKNSNQDKTCHVVPPTDQKLNIHCAKIENLPLVIIDQDKRIHQLALVFHHLYLTCNLSTIFPLKPIIIVSEKEYIYTSIVLIAPYCSMHAANHYVLSQRDIYSLFTILNQYALPSSQTLFI